jgi:hypothetical protein
VYSRSTACQDILFSVAKDDEYTYVRLRLIFAGDGVTRRTLAMRAEMYSDSHVMFVMFQQLNQQTHFIS